MSSRESGGSAERRVGRWMPRIDLHVPLGWMHSRPAVWVPVVALAVVRDAPPECYGAIATIISMISVTAGGSHA